MVLRRSPVARAAVLVCGLALLTMPAAAADAPLRLVEVAWVDAHRNDPDVVLLDASPAPMYAANHLPGAISVDAMSYGGREAPPADTERMYQSWGIGPATRVVVYDQGATFMATRLFFSLVYHGVPERNVFVMNGGLAKWMAAGLPVTKDLPQPRKAGAFRIRAARDDMRVRLPEFVTGTGDPRRYALVEALGADWHFGQVQPFGRPGHPPFGISWPSADLFNADKTFKSPDDLRRMATYLGIRPDQTVYTYCGGGVAASAPFFALKYILGYPDVKMFVESELGWVSDPRGLPYWTYDAPFLLRDSGWLQWTGGQMARTYLGAAVSVIDIRPADRYAEGHVPFALSIPADVFRQHAANPAALAEVLGKAGVDAAHEAVVISGGGLTADAALAFVLLERLGQAKVSVFVDTLERWAGLGYTLPKSPTVVGPKKGPADLAIEPKPYGAAARGGVVAKPGAAGAGPFPTVFIASGRGLPSKAPAGTVVHVPAADLVNADGTPRPAKDLWAALTKAGVPRYASLVCVADDPGDAAVNYVLLKLMGYPDVTILMP